MKYLFSISLSLLVLLGLGFKTSPQGPKMQLSDYGFFTGDIAEHQPIASVVPYQLNTPLFSDYAEKLRFVQLPEGQTVA